MGTERKPYSPPAVLESAELKEETVGECAYHDLWQEGEPCTCPPGLCRRCSDCLGQNHHWMVHGVPISDECPHGEPMSTDCEACINDAPDYICKHCPAQGDECPECGLGIEPEETCPKCQGVGIVVRVEQTDNMA